MASPIFCPEDARAIFQYVYLMDWYQMLQDRSRKAKRLDPKKIAAALGAEPIGKAPAKGGFHGALQSAANRASHMGPEDAGLGPNFPAKDQRIAELKQLVLDLRQKAEGLQAEMEAKAKEKTAILRRMARVKDELSKLEQGEVQGELF